MDRADEHEDKFELGGSFGRLSAPCQAFDGFDVSAGRGETGVPAPAARSGARNRSSKLVAGWLFKWATKFGPAPLQRGSGARRHENNVAPPSRTHVGACRAANDDVRIGAADTKRTHASDARAASRRPRQAVHDKDGVPEIRSRHWFRGKCKSAADADVRPPVPSRRAPRFRRPHPDADVRLDRAEPARASPGGAEGLTQGLDLDRITECCSGPVGLDIADVAGNDVRGPVRRSDYVGLSLHAWRAVKPTLRGAVDYRWQFP